MLTDRLKDSIAILRDDMAARRLRPRSRMGRRLVLEPLEARELLSISSTTGINPLTPAPIVGNTYTGTVATFTATDSGPFQATINWGDGHSSPGSILGSGGDYSVEGTHTYASLSLPGSPDNVTVTITDATDPAGSAPSVALSTAAIADAPITITPLTIDAVRGTPTPAEDVALFTVTNPFASASTYAATIDWGDNTPTTTGTIVEDGSGVFHVMASHDYTTVGTYDIGVTVQNTGGSSAFLTTPSSAIVSPSSITAQGAAIDASQGTPFANQVVATFTDTGGPQPVSDYAATITWGDNQQSTATIVPTGGSSFAVEASHAYSTGGSFTTQVTLTSDGTSAATTTGQVTVAWLPPILSPIAITSADRQEFQGAVASFTLAPGTAPEAASDFVATINWGDGSAPTQGIVSATADGYTVSGTHGYADVKSATSQSFPVTVTVEDLLAGTQAQTTGQATVDAVPIILTGQLDPSSDTGVSATDAITSDNLPQFEGTSEPFTTITVTARPTAGGNPILLGTAEAGASGSWTLTDDVPLADGEYNIVAVAVDQGGVNSATTTLLPNAGQGPLTIDTQGPVVTSLVFHPRRGQFMVTFDGRAGLDLQTLLTGSNYVFKKISSGTRSDRAQHDLVTKLVLTTSGNGSASIVGTINHGRRLVAGRYELTIQSGGPSGIQDVAGNALNGEFYGDFPSGDGQVGGNFVALLDDIAGIVSPPRLMTSSASPDAPSGTAGA